MNHPLVVGIALLAMGLANFGWCADGAPPVGPARGKADSFEPTRIAKVHVTIAAKEYAAMQPRAVVGFGGLGGFGAPKPKPPTPDDPARKVHRNTFNMELPWAAASINVDDETFKDVGIRYKGNGTIIDASRTIAKSLKIDLDHLGGTARFGESKSINLHSGVADPSKSRETLGYGLYRAAGVPASRTTLAEVRLTVPGKYDQELLGVYTIVEAVDKPFLRAHFGSDKGLLMKPEIRVVMKLDGGLRDFEFKGEDWSRYEEQLGPKRKAEPAEAKRIIAFARLVHKADDAEFRQEITSYLDVDAYLRFLATTAFISNMDSFFTLGHNFFLYLHPQTGRLHFIPWDVDRAFANLPIFGSSTQQMDLSFTRPYAGVHRLTDRLLAMPEMSAKYQALLKELAATCFAKATLMKQVESIEAATKELLERGKKAADARKEGGGFGFGPPAGFGKPPPLKTFVEKRTESMMAQLAGKSKGFIPAAGFGFGGGGGFKISDMMATPLMTTLDVDKDAKLSKAEWVALAQKVYAASEKDKQGWVNQKEIVDGLNTLLPKPPAGAPPPPPGFTAGNFLAPAIVKRADADKDGKVTLDELVDAAGKLFDERDQKKAGSLDATAFGEMLNALFPVPNFGAPNPGAAPGKPKTENKKKEAAP